MLGSKALTSPTMADKHPLIVQPLSESPHSAVHGNELPLFRAYAFRASDITALGTTIIVYSYDAVWPEIRTNHLPNDEQMH